MNIEKRLRFSDAIEKFKNITVMVIGDVMLDEYVTGKVKRISPEAPVPVLNFTSSRYTAGGASNVALNVKSLGCKTYMSGVTGSDSSGHKIETFLEENGVNTEPLVKAEDRMTTVKRRFTTSHQQLLREDIENTDPISSDIEHKILEELNKKIDDLDAVILSDYQKGVLVTPSFIQKIISICERHGVVITIDSKATTLEAFKGATFVKPNNLELENAVNIKIKDEKSLEEAGQKYLSMSQAKVLLVTRGSDGISVFRNGRAREDFPAAKVQVYDVSGAGDTVISTCTLGLVAGLTMNEAVELSNIAAAVVISKFGTSVVTADELIEKVHEE